MAYEYNKNLDSEPVSDGSGAFSGVVSAAKATVLDAAELAELRNGDIGAYGTAGSRPPAAIVATGLSDDFLVDENGQTIEDENGLRIVGEGYANETQALWFFNVPGNPLLLFFADGKLYTCAGPGADGWAIDAQTFNAAGKISCAQLADKAHVVDQAALRVLALVGDVWTWTSVPYFKVYNETSEAYEDDASKPIPAASILETHVGRLCMAGISDASYPADSIFFSDYLDGTVWENIEQLVIGGDGDPIVALKSWRENYLLVFKRNSVWAVVCSPLVDDSGTAVSVGSWTVKRLSDAYGCVSRESVAMVGNDVWFLSKSGVVSVQRAAATDTTEISLLPISSPVQDVIDAVNWEAADTAAAAFFKGRYFLSLPTGLSLHPDTTLVYNTTLGKWQGVWEGTAMRQTGYTRATFSGQEVLLWRTHDAAVYAWKDADTAGAADLTDVGEEVINLRLRTKGYVFQAAGNPKRPRKLEVEFWQSEGTADIYVSLDSGELIRVSPAEGLRISSAPRLPLILPFSLAYMPALRFAFSIRHLPRFRELQVVVDTREGRARVRNVELSALIIPTR